MCVVCVLSSHLFWTSDLWTHQPGSHRRKVTQDFSSIFLLRCLPSFLSREEFSRPFPSPTVKSTFVYPRINRLFVQLHRDSNSRPTHVRRFRCKQLNHRGDRQRKRKFLGGVDASPRGVEEEEEEEVGCLSSELQHQQKQTKQQESNARGTDDRWRPLTSPVSQSYDKMSVRLDIARPHRRRFLL